MPYSIASIQLVNEQFGRFEGFAPNDLLPLVEGIDSVLEGLDALGALQPDRIDQANADAMRRHLLGLPPALDQMILAALRSALRRGLRTQVTWKPGYDWELQAWESSDAPHGLLNLLVVSPHPEEIPPGSS